MLKMTYIGGPTVLLELDGFRLLTDPTFDPAGTEYKPGPYTLRKTQDPAVRSDAVGTVDLVLLSHDHHYDNLDHEGRVMLSRVVRVLTTPEGARRLGGNATGLKDWESLDLALPDGNPLRVTSTPARHGPEGGDRGPVTGFVLQIGKKSDRAIYLSGDTVWYDGVAEVARRFEISVAVLFMGAARIHEVGPAHLTMTAYDGVNAARAFPNAAIVPLHFEGWAHFTEGREEIQQTYNAAGLGQRLQWLHGDGVRRLVW